MVRVIFAFILCILGIVISGSCYAQRQVIPLTLKCKPSIQEADWKRLKADPNATYSLTTQGLEVAGQERLLTDRREIETYILGGTDTVFIQAECTPSQGGRPMDMFPNRVSAAGITLTCQKGQGLAIMFGSPNDPDPKKYVYHAQVTVDRDDPPVQPVDLTQGMRVDLPQRGMVPPTMMGMGIGGSSIY